MLCGMRLWRPLLVILVPALFGEAVFLVISVHRGPNDYDATADLAIGACVAGMLALAASLILLRSRFKSLVHAVLAAALIIPLWYAYAVVVLFWEGDSS